MCLMGKPPAYFTYHVAAILVCHYTLQLNSQKCLLLGHALV